MRMTPTSYIFENSVNTLTLFSEIASDTDTNPILRFIPAIEAVGGVFQAELPPP